MKKDDYYRDDVERTQRVRTTGRRSGRLRRKRTYALVTLLFLVLVVVATPSIICHSPIARSVTASTLAGYGFDGNAASIRIGWITPLCIEGVDLTGKTAGTHLKVDRIETGLSLLQCLRGLSDLGEIAVRGVTAELTVADGHSSAEVDLALLLAPSDEPREATGDGKSSSLAGKISVQDLAVRITDSVTGAQWIADQSQAEIVIDPINYDITFSSVLSDSQSGSGELQGRVQYPVEAGQAYKIEMVTQRVPLSFASLAKRRLGEDGASIPSQISGDTTGTITVVGGADDSLSIAVSPMEFRNFVASDASLGERVWRNGLLVLSGAATLDGDRILGRKLQVTTDFGSASFDGAFKQSMSLSGETNPAAWLEALDGSAGVAIDLVALERALPGLIPLRDQAEITAGKIAAEITSSVEQGGVRRSHWSLTSQPIHASAAGRGVVIEPLTLVASLKVAGGQLTADTVRLESSFANATASGDLSSGRVKGDIQFSRLAAMIQPLLEMPELSLAGQTTAELQWAAGAGDQWNLVGNAKATDLMLALPGGINFRQPAVQTDIEAKGRWVAGTLEELNGLKLLVSTSSLEATALLAAPVAMPSSTTRLPLQITSRGRLETLAEILGPWLPTSIHTLQGGYSATADAQVALASGEVTGAKLQIEEPRLGYGEQLYVQPKLDVVFAGRYAWPAGELEARSLTIVGDAISAAVQGTMVADTMNLEVAYRTKLDRLYGAMRPSVAGNRPLTTTSPVGFRNETAAAPSPYQFLGDCDGNLKLVRESQSPWLSITSHITGNQITVVQPTVLSSYGTPPQSQPVTAAPIWSERLVNVDAIVRYEMNDGRVEADKLQMATDWIAANLAGKAIWNDAIGDVAMRGSARIKMPEVAAQLSKLLGLTVRLEGVHETPIDLVAARQGSGPVAMNVKANLGWESGEVAGIAFGPTSIPITANETTVSIEPAAIPVIQGRLQVAGDLNYSPGPMQLIVRPGVVAEDLKLTPELTSRWMQYLAPMLANSARIEGTFGVELAQAIVNIDAPMTSQARGNLRVQGVNMDSGPVANQLIGSIKQIQQLVRGLPAQDVQQKDKRLVTMPAQAIDFEFANGVITHQRMFMDIDRARVITSGQVHVDGRLKLVAQVPLDESWLGSDLKGFAGQPITLPIDGTLSKPSLDAAAIRGLVGQLGTQAVQGAADKYLEKQLGRGLDKLFGR